MDAYVRVRALRAAMVSIIQSRNIEQAEIGSFLPPVRKKSLEGIHPFLG
ncbi:MAG: hypothetical protein LKG23_16675 [Nitrospira sp.]|jgi:hypothetical protein|nr:hypothetical protein [Nitrospira sp.]